MGEERMASEELRERVGSMKTILLAALSLSCAGAAWAETFTLHGQFYSVGPNPVAIVAADFNGNGWPEIITADRGLMSDPSEERPANDELAFLVAEGDLDYTAQPPLRADFAPYALAVANVASPRQPDLLVGSFMATRQRDLSYFRNIGDNLFESSHFNVRGEYLPYTQVRDSDEQPVFTRPGITSITVGDFNGNGRQDVIATGWSSDVLLFFPGLEGEHFGEPRTISAPGGARSVEGVDLDGNGTLDLVAAMYSSHEVAVWRGEGDGQFEPVTRFPSRGRLPHRIRAADMNGNGRKDLVVSHCYGDDSVVIFYGDGAFGFASSQEMVLGENRNAIEHEIRDMAVADFTGNGRPDIAVACYASSRVTVMLNRSEGETLPQRFEMEHYSFERGRPRALSVADFNRNGRPDIAVALWEANAVALLLNGDEDEGE